jgi:hypothetical protein
LRACFFGFCADLDDKLSKLSGRFTFKEGAGEKLSTMKGVFIPTLQNILGIILFVRLPWITGQVGRWRRGRARLCAEGTEPGAGLGKGGVAVGWKMPVASC